MPTVDCSALAYFRYSLHERASWKFWDCSWHWERGERGRGGSAEVRVVSQECTLLQKFVRGEYSIGKFTQPKFYISTWEAYWPFKYIVPSVSRKFSASIPGYTRMLLHSILISNRCSNPALHTPFNLSMDISASRVTRYRFSWQRQYAVPNLWCRQ